MVSGKPQRRNRLLWIVLESSEPVSAAGQVRSPCTERRGHSSHTASRIRPNPFLGLHAHILVIDPIGADLHGVDQTVITVRTTRV
ncbi:MAG: hypothetical protein IJH84_10030, partial [Saccharopolyspora sp.]|uniref:hypothetical protein n=1 Tax=Saccharopolyspora sp. TaxID=33915 RepID=UPI0025DECDFA